MAIFLLSISLGASCPPSACNGFGNSMCPGAAVLDSEPIWPLGPKNLWFRNVAKWPVDVLVVSPEGDEESRGMLAPEVRKPHAAIHGEVPHTPPSRSAPTPTPPTGGCFHVGAVSTQALLGTAARAIVAGRADGQRQDQPLRCQQQLTELAPSSRTEMSSHTGGGEA